MAYVYEKNYHEDSNKVTLLARLNRFYDKDETPVSKFDIASTIINLAVDLEKMSKRLNWHSPEPVVIHVEYSLSTVISITATAPENRTSSLNGWTPSPSCRGEIESLYELIRSKLSKIIFIRSYIRDIVVDHCIRKPTSEIDPAALHLQLLREALPPESHPLLESDNDNIYRAVWIMAEHQAELGLF